MLLLSDPLGFHPTHVQSFQPKTMRTFVHTSRVLSMYSSQILAAFPRNSKHFNLPGLWLCLFYSMRLARLCWRFISLNHSPETTSKKKALWWYSHPISFPPFLFVRDLNPKLLKDTFFFEATPISQLSTAGDQFCTSSLSYGRISKSLLW
jgi:hypothetical protein